MLASLRILDLSLASIGIRIFFLDGPLVVIWILGLGLVLPKLILFISIIFFAERARKVSRSLRRLELLLLVA